MFTEGKRVRPTGHVRRLVGALRKATGSPVLGRRARRYGGPALIAGLAALSLLSASHAEAATRYEHAGPFGSPAEFGNPQRMVVHQESGLLFVADREGARVRVYEPDADDLLVHLTDIDASDRAAGNLSNPSAVTIDQETGDLYVAKTGSPAELVRFTPADSSNPVSFTEDTSFTSPAGVTWGQASPGLGRAEVRGGLAIGRDANDDPVIFVANPATDLIQAFDHAGAPLSVFKGLIFAGPTFACLGCDSGVFTDLVDIATGPDGALYAVDIQSLEVRLTRIALNGTTFDFDKEWATHMNTGAGGVPHVAVDQVSNEIFVANKAHFIQIEGPTADEPAFTSQPIIAEELGSSITGVAVQGTPDPASGGRLYLGHARFPLIGGALEAGIEVYDSGGVIAPPPAATADPVAAGDVTATTASVSGQVTPNEEGAMWRFEARRCTDSGCDAWPDPPPAGPPLQGPIVAADYSQPQSVEFELAGLEPNSDYEIRLRAVNSTASIVSSPAETFTTKVAPPEVETRSAASISARRATLVGNVDPRNSDVRYFFELTPEGGDPVTLPAEPASLGADAGPSQVTTEATGLGADREYSYRLVAHVAADEDMRSKGDLDSFRTRPAAESAIPERAYELVSPRFTNAADTVVRMLSPDGNRASFSTFIPLPDSENMGFDERVSRRNPDGSWTTLPHKAGSPVTLDSGNLDAATAPLLNRPMTRAAFETPGGFDHTDLNGTSDQYLRDLDSGELRSLTAASGGSRGAPLYVSDDGRQVIFSSATPLLPTDQRTTAGDGTLYEWRDGTIRQLAFRPGQTQGPTEASVLGSGIGGQNNFGEFRNAVSRDGERIVFSLMNASNRPDELYVNDGGEIVEVATGEATFWGASADVETVVYTKAGDLYTFDLDSETSELVHPPLAGGAGVYRALHVSDDGSRIYFASTKDVLGGNRDTDPYGLWVADRADQDAAFSIRYIGPVSEGSGASDGWNKPVTLRQYGADPDGDVLAFRSSTELVPGRRTGGTPQVYAYEYDRDAIYCLSCPPDGSDPGPVFGSLQRSIRPVDGVSSRVAAFDTANRPPQVVAENGSVVFQAASRLVPQDTNSFYDVFEWRGGEIALVSSGTSAETSGLGEISSDGRTVVFDSRADLVPGLPEAAVARVYAARVDGGFESDEIPPNECRGNECRATREAPSPPERSAAGMRRSGRANESTKPGRNCRALAKRIRSNRRAVNRSRTNVRRLARKRAGSRRSKAARADLKRKRAQLKRLRRKVKDCRRVGR